MNPTEKKMKMRKSKDWRNSRCNALCLVLGISMMRNIQAEPAPVTSTRTENLRSGEHDPTVYNDVTDTTGLIKFVLNKETHQKAEFSPPTRNHWTPERPEPLGCNDTSITFRYVVIGDQHQASEAFLVKFSGTVGSCEGGTGGGGPNTFEYTLIQQNGIRIDPESQVTGVDTWVELVARDQRTNEKIDVIWEIQKDSAPVLELSATNGGNALSLVEEGDVHRTVAALDTVWIKSERGGSFEIKARRTVYENGSETEFPAQAKIDVYELVILGTPMEIFASAQLDIPIAFKIYGPTEVGIENISSTKFNFIIDGKNNEFPIRTRMPIPLKDEIVAGNYYDRNCEKDNVHTILIPHLRYLNLMLGAQKEIFFSPMYEIKMNISINGTENIILEKSHEIEFFAKKTRFVVPYGQRRVFDARDYLDINGNSASIGWRMLEPITSEFMPLPFPATIIGSARDRNTTGQTWGPSTGSSFHIETHIRSEAFTGGAQQRIQTGVYDKRRGFYFITYYGAQDVDGRSVIDVSNTGLGNLFSVNAWRNSAFNVEIINTDGPAASKPLAMELSMLATSVTAISILSSTIQGVAIPPLGWISFAFSVGAVVAEAIPLTNHKENAVAYIYNNLIINDNDGTPRSGGVSSPIGNNGYNANGTKIFTPIEQNGMVNFENQGSFLFEVVSFISTATVQTDSKWEGLILLPRILKSSIKFSGGDELVEIQWSK